MSTHIIFFSYMNIKKDMKIYNAKVENRSRYKTKIHKDCQLY